MSARALMTRGRINAQALMTRGRVAALTVLLPTFGAGRVIHASIIPRIVRPTTGVPSMSIALNTSTFLNDLHAGDSYSITLTDTLAIAGTIQTARFLVKRAFADADAAALIDISVTTAASNHGQITVDGTAGPYTVLINLLPSDTVKLVNIAYPSRNFDGLWEVRLTTVAGAEYTAVLDAPLKAMPRLIKSS
ncbi:MAG: hypothetical protein JWO59_758 [Chloroflexi bacterium]|nr:hypothetical protein [Chloroflexota bacterium]